MIKDDLRTKFDKTTRNRKVSGRRSKGVELNELHHSPPECVVQLDSPTTGKSRFYLTLSEPCDDSKLSFMSRNATGNAGCAI